MVTVDILAACTYMSYINLFGSASTEHNIVRLLLDETHNFSFFFSRSIHYAEIKEKA